jgi:hypothetical protein
MNLKNIEIVLKEYCYESENIEIVLKEYCYNLGEDRNYVERILL